MRTIEVDEDLYRYIAQNTIEIGEPASKILRRMLGMDVPKQGASVNPAGEHELAATLQDPRFRVEGTAVQKLLHILKAVHDQKGTEFEKVLSDAVQGRGRKYFALSEAEIKGSGNSTQPRNIPGTRYWVMTNSPTTQKKEMLKDVLVLLGYSEAAVRAAVATIG